PGRLGGDAAALELREHHPAELPDLLAPPVAVPVADRADALAGLVVDDLEHPPRPGLGEALETLLPLDELLLALRPAEVLRPLRVAERPAQERQVALAPGLEADAHPRLTDPSSAIVQYGLCATSHAWPSGSANAPE